MLLGHILTVTVQYLLSCLVLVLSWSCLVWCWCWCWSWSWSWSCRVVPCRVVSCRVLSCLVYSSRKATIECELKFNLIDVDPATGEHESEGFEESFPLEPLVVTTADFIAKFTVPDFRATWESISEDNQAGESFGLKFKSIGEAVSRCIDFIGMQPCENTAGLRELFLIHCLWQYR